MQNKSQKDPVIKYPCRVEIIRHEEVVSQLPNTETLPNEANSNKAILKHNKSSHVSEQKGAEQSLETYSMLDITQS